MAHAKFRPEHTKLLLFDLGGVLVDFSGPRDLLPFLPAPSTSAHVMQRWAQCPHTQAFEARKLSASDWSSRFVRDWGLTLTPEQFLAEFEGWSRGFFPGAVELLSALRPRYRLAALSNSNPLHWARNARLGIPGHFEFVMSSHEVGCCKPERAIFEAALQRAGLPAEDVVFFDDLQKNVDGAKAVGIRAWQVQGVEGVMQCLRAQRLLEQSWTIKAST